MGIFSFLFGSGHKPQYLKDLVDNGAVIVDVRSVAEFRLGHIKYSTNIPLQTIAEKVSALKQKNKPVITVCKSGARSGMAVTMLKKAGIEAYNGGHWNVLDHHLK